MANELTVHAGLVFDNGTLYVPFGKHGLQFTVSGSDYLRNTQAIGDTEEAIYFGDVAKGGYFIGFNTHASYVIEIRPNTAVADLVRLEAGDVCMFRVTDDAVPYAIASTAGAVLEYLVVDP